MDSPAARHRSPDYGGKLGHAIFHAVIRWLGVTPAYLLLAFIVPYYVLLRPRVRRSAAPYLSRRFPGQGPARRLLTTFLYLYRFGQVLIDQGVIGILGRERLRVDFPEERTLYELAREGRGLVLLTTHAGNWRAAMATMNRLDVAVNFQFQLEPHMAGRHFFDLAGEQHRFKIISPTGFLGGVIEMTHALKNGECVAVMGDRAFGAQTRRTSFLGEDAAFPVIPYQLALSTGAELVVLLTVRTGKLRCRIEMTRLTGQDDGAAMGREAAIGALQRRYVACLEGYLQKYPFMWLNFFDIWKGTPKTDSAEKP